MDTSLLRELVWWLRQVAQLEDRILRQPHDEGSLAELCHEYGRLFFRLFGCFSSPAEAARQLRGRVIRCLNESQSARADDREFAESAVAALQDRFSFAVPGLSDRAVRPADVATAVRGRFACALEPATSDDRHRAIQATAEARGLAEELQGIVNRLERNEVPSPPVAESRGNWPAVSVATVVSAAGPGANGEDRVSTATSTPAAGPPVAEGRGEVPTATSTPSGDNRETLPAANPPVNGSKVTRYGNKIALACELVQKYPEWCDAEVAREAKTTPPNLAQSERYQAIAKEARDRAARAHGRKQDGARSDRHRKAKTSHG
jgi:hypothetical protein